MVLSLTLTQPDDWHVHLRDGDALTHTVLASARHFARVLVMPNLTPALTRVHDLLTYRERIVKAKPPHNDFQPFMTFYLNESISPDELTLAKQHAFILGGKLYPAGATTNSSEGATSIRALYPLFSAMQELDLVLQIHGEVTHGDIFDREALFIEEWLIPITRAFPKLRIVLEHISTRSAVDFVTAASPSVAATITPHHLMYHRNHFLVGGVKPHYYCLPILKRQTDQTALIQAAVSGNPKFFIGTDSAPHARHTKESACGCAGIYSAPFALALYAEVFAQQQRLDKLEAFISRFGAEFYHQPLNRRHITLRQTPQCVPETLPFGTTTVVPMAAGETLAWSVECHD